MENAPRTPRPQVRTPNLPHEPHDLTKHPPHSASVSSSSRSRIFRMEKKKKLNFGSEETQFLIQKHGLERITSGDQNKTCSCQVALSLLIRNNNCPRSPTRWPPTQRSFSQSRVTQSPAPAWEIIFLGRYLSPWWGGNPVNKEEKWISRTPPAAWH